MKIELRLGSIGPTGTGAVAAALAILAVVMFIASGLLLTACDLLSESSSNLPTPNSKVAYVRSVVGNDNALYAVDVDNDQVVGQPLPVGRADYGSDKSMAIAPNGRLYLLRGMLGHPFGRPHADHGLLILDPNTGWQRTEPPMSDDGAAVGISRDGKAFILRSKVQPDRTLQLDVYDTASDALIKSDRVRGLVGDIVAGGDGLVYLSPGANPDVEPPQPAGIQVIRSGDLETVANIPFPRYYAHHLELGPDGLLYAAVSRRLAAGEPELTVGARMENVGLLVAVDPNTQRVVAELEVPVGPYDLAITPEGKAYILTTTVLQGGQPSKVSVYDLKQRKLLSELPIGKDYSFIKQVSPTKVYAATRGIDEEKGRIWVIDTRSDTIINSFQVGERPVAIATTFSP